MKRLLWALTAGRLSLIWIACTACACAQVITTIAGTDWVFPSSKLPALSAPLGRTEAVVVNSAGDVFVLDSGNNMVMRISQDGLLTVVAGNGKAGFSGDGGPATAASLEITGYTVSGIALDSAGNLYIADSYNCRVRKIAADGTITTVAGNGRQDFSGDGGPAKSAALSYPSGIAVDNAGNVFISDSYNQRIRKVAPNGIITTVAGNGSPAFSGDGGLATNAALNYPSGIALDPTGNLYIADSNNGRIRKVTPDGRIATIGGSGNAVFSDATSVAVDTAGNLYVLDGLVGKAFKLAQNGTMTILAGNGKNAFSGDGGPATSAALNFPNGLTVDTTGNLYVADTSNSRVRKISSNGIINTLAGNGGFRFSGDGGPATSATLNYPSGVAADSMGNIYIADRDNNRVRRVTPAGIVTTVAGTGTPSYSGDGGPATNATLFSPSAVVTDAVGNLYIGDTINSCVRKVVPSGIITTIAGRSDDPATSIFIDPRGLAVDAVGNIYIADFDSSSIRMVTPAGKITTVAGNGTSGFSGDGGSATKAQLKYVSGVAIDPTGTLYIADAGNRRVRKVTSDGIITTFAGNGNTGTSGDGGLAINASFWNPYGVATDRSGNLYIADDVGYVIRKVSANGIITTVAGNGQFGFSGDGGLATTAALKWPYGVAVDSVGNLYIADTFNHRIRMVSAQPVSYQATPVSLSFSALAGGTAPNAQTINLSPSISGLTFTTSSSAAWLTVNPSQGAMPATVQVSVDPGQLVAGNASGTVTITAANASPRVQTVTVNVAVTAAPPPKLAVGSQNLAFSLTKGASSVSAQLSVSNQGGGSLTFAASLSTSSGGNWLQVSPTSGTLTALTPASLTVTASSGNLAAGTYRGVVTISSASTSEQISVGVTLSINLPQPKILLSQSGLTFISVAQGGSALPQSIGILNAGSGTLNWTAQASTQSGSGWLSLSSTNGTVNRPFLDVSFTNAIIDSQFLSPGDYFGSIEVRAPGADNSPQTIVVVLKVLPPGSNPGLEIRPTGLVFTGVAGTTPGSQDVLVGNLQAQADSFISGKVGNGFTYSPPSATIQPNVPQTLRVFPDYTNLSAGTILRGTITLQSSDGTPRNVRVLIVVAASGVGTTQPGPVIPVGDEADRFATACQPTKLFPIFVQLGSGPSVPSGFPATVLARVVDDCGSPMTSGSVVTSFSNGDSPLSLISLQDGQWSATWQPRNISPTGVTVYLTAQVPEMSLLGTTQAIVGLQGNPTLPLSTGLVNAVTLTEGPIAPGELVLIKGSGLANGQASSQSAPLLQQLAGASIVMGGRRSSLLYADNSQLVGLVPSDLPTNSSQQVVLQRDNILGVPTAVIVAATQPAVFTKDGSGKGQALVYKTSGGRAAALADAARPVQPGDIVVIYCAGLGALDSQGRVTNPATVTIGGQPSQVNYAGSALKDGLPSEGAPSILGVSTGLGGLYQITATIPNGVANGQASVFITSGGQTSPPGATLAVSGSAVHNTATSVSAASYTAPLASEVIASAFGADLANATQPAPSVPLPVSLAGTQVAVRDSTGTERLAPLFFVSPGQVNYEVPAQTANGAATVTITSGDGVVSTGAIDISTVAPGLFTANASGQGVAAAIAVRATADGKQTMVPVYQCPGGAGTCVSTPIDLGAATDVVVLELFGTGFRGRSSVTNVSCMVGGIGAAVAYAGAQGAYVGLDQVNVYLPRSLVGRGEVDVNLVVDGHAANTVRINVK